MKKLHLNLIALITLTFTSLSLLGQVSINVITDEDCQEFVLTLNDNVELSENNCAFSTDFSDLVSGDNTISVTSDLNPLYKTSTLDMVFLMKAIDEGFESYAEAIAGDFDNDMVISTNDLIAMRRVILGIENEIPAKIKLATIEQVFEPMVGLNLDSDHLSITFADGELEDGVAKDIAIVVVGNL